MATKVFVPSLGEGVDEVTETKWLKRVGDSVKELEPLLEVNTDKVDTEIPAPASGTVLQIVAQEGVPAKVGELLAIIGVAGENVENISLLTVSAQKIEAPKGIASESSTTDYPQGMANPDPGFVSPAGAQNAAKHSIKFLQIQGKKFK